MYLSKVIAKGNIDGNTYHLHQNIWTLFQGDPDADRDFLYRVEGRPQNGWSTVLLQSARQPRTSQAHLARVLDSRLYNASLEAGDVLRFKLLANPVKTIPDQRKRQNAKGRIKSVRVPLIHEDQQLAWLKRKYGDAAEVDQVQVQKHTPFLFTKHRGKQRNNGKIQPCIFTGTLRVRDPEALIQLIGQGIGPAKGMGCGMLSIARSA
jgi:CRISPR system Cascade subunit CasE